VEGGVFFQAQQDSQALEMVDLAAQGEVETEILEVVLFLLVEMLLLKLEVVVVRQEEMVHQEELGDQE
jgi:hypothetical protein